MSSKNDSLTEKLGVSPSPMNCIVIGMAGSGKTTLLQRVKACCNEKKTAAYMVNLDPAVLRVPYRRDIDIRNSVDFPRVMEQYSLGPNGAILTSLNLFSTKFDRVIDLVNSKSQQLKYAFYDTPGQVEVFTWSASGAIITESLSSSFPTAIIFVIDTERSTSPVTFVSNIMYAISILYKTNLPLLLVFNKIDLAPHSNISRWLEDPDSLEEALSEDKSYMATLSSSLSSVLFEFSRNVEHVGVSAATGQGMEAFFAKLRLCEAQYHSEYLPFLLNLKEENRSKREFSEKEQLEKLRKDLGAMDLGGQ